MTNETFSDRLKLAMQAKQFKQVDLIRAAQRRGVKLGKSHVSQYVSGKTVPRSDILHFLADVLQVDPDWLLAKDSTVNYTADTVPIRQNPFLIHLPLPFPRQKQEVPLCENLKNHRNSTMSYMMSADLS